MTFNLFTIWKNQEFLLLYIFEDSQNRVLMQRKVNIFAQIIQFISGPIIQCFTNYPILTQIVFKMIDEWNSLSESITFMLEVSYSHYYCGNDLVNQSLLQLNLF